MEKVELLVRSFVESNPRDAAQAFDKLEVAEAVEIIETLPFRTEALVLERLTPIRASAILERLDPKRRRELLAIMPPRTASSLLQHLEKNIREEALTHLPEKVARQIRELMHYPPDTAGGMMEPRVTSIPVDLTVQSAVAHFRKAPRQTLYYLYVTDRDGKLIGVLNMRDLLLASPRDRIETLVHKELLSVPVTMSREDVVTLMRRHRFLALPVLDSEGRLIGVIRHDEALRAGQLEAFENLQKMVGAGGDERALSTGFDGGKTSLALAIRKFIDRFPGSSCGGPVRGYHPKGNRPGRAPPNCFRSGRKHGSPSPGSGYARLGSSRDPFR